MSSYDEAAKQAETQQQQQKGPETFLSQAERMQVQRFLRFPEEFPPKFGAWITEYLSTNFPQIPISQITGFKQVETKWDTKDTTQKVTSGTTEQSILAAPVKIPGGSLGPLGVAEFVIRGSAMSWAGGTSNKISYKLKLGATTITTIEYEGAAGLSGPWELIVSLDANYSQSSQIWWIDIVELAGSRRRVYATTSINLGEESGEHNFDVTVDSSTAQAYSITKNVSRRLILPAKT